jgi:predicted transcriptional regulator
LSQADFEAFKRQTKKERILMELFAREASYPMELAKLTDSDVGYIDQLLNELVADKLIENVAAKYYKLTYEGYNRVKSTMKQKY